LEEEERMERSAGFYAIADTHPFLTSDLEVFDEERENKEQRRAMICMQLRRDVKQITCSG
jgi:hypothetical protein